MVQIMFTLKKIIKKSLKKMEVVYFSIGVLSVMVVLLTIFIIVGMKTLSKLKEEYKIQVNITDRRFENLYNEKHQEVNEIYRNINDHVSDLQRQINK
jgi:hypothetical protein